MGEGVVSGPNNFSPRDGEKRGVVEVQVHAQPLTTAKGRHYFPPHPKSTLYTHFLYLTFKLQEGWGHGPMLTPPKYAIGHV